MHRGHFQVPCGMAIRGGRRQSICLSYLRMGPSTEKKKLKIGKKRNKFEKPAKKPILSTQVPQTCTDLDLSLLYILI